MHFFFFLSAFFAVSFYSFAGNDNRQVGSRGAAIGNATVASSGVFSFSSNQAGLHSVKHLTAAVSYESKYLLNEISLQSLVVAAPLFNGTTAISAVFYGNKFYREKKIGFAYSRLFGETFSAGIQFDHFSLFIADGYADKNFFVSEFGLQARLSDLTILGAHIYNFTRQRLLEYDNERIPSALKLGLSHQVSPLVDISFEVEKEISSSVFFKAGIEYRPIRQVFIGTGINTGNSLFSFGFGYNYSSFQLDIAASFHKQLGFSPQLSLAYDFK